MDRAVATAADPASKVRRAPFTLIDPNGKTPAVLLIRKTLDAVVPVTVRLVTPPVCLTVPIPSPVIDSMAE